jgi:hypothetical protein
MATGVFQPLETMGRRVTLLKEATSLARLAQETSRRKEGARTKNLQEARLHVDGVGAAAPGS